MKQLLNLFALALAGIMGTLARYSLIVFIPHKIYGHISTAVITINIIGSLIAGFFWRSKIFDNSPNLKLIIFVGLIGVFTTFSAFALETLDLINAQKIKLALLDIGLNNVLGLISVAVGLLLARMITS